MTKQLCTHTNIINHNCIAGANAIHNVQYYTYETKITRLASEL